MSMVAPTSGDSPEIAAALGYLCESGDIHELRVMTKLYGTVAGSYRLPDHTSDFVRDALRYNDAHSVYFTLNPVQPEAVKGRLGLAATHQARTVRDMDIARRRWLPIDFDHRVAHREKRPATDAEVQACVDRARTVGGWLVKTIGLNATSIVGARSGNGAHLLVRVDLPNDSDARDLLSDVLLGLAVQFDDDAVEIDARCYNAARIWKVYGTHARKGVETAEHPHRKAALNDKLPTRPVPCDVQALYRIAVLAPHAPAEEAGSYDGPSVIFDIDRFITQHFPAARQKQPYSDGFRWILNQCPFDADHKGSSVAIIQRSRGGLSFVCQHNGCRDKRWSDVRELLEPRTKAEKRAAAKQQPPAAAPVPDAPHDATPEPAQDDGPAIVPQEPVGRPHLTIVPREPDEAQVPSIEESLRFTDVGNAKLLRELCGEDYRWVPQWKEWMHWTGSFWTPDPKRSIMEEARKVGPILQNEADEQGKGEKDPITRWAKRSRNTPGLRAMVEDLSTHHGMAVVPEELDMGSWLFNCANGTLDLRQDEMLLPPRREHLLTKASHWRYTPEATCPMWEDALLFWMDGDEAMVRYLQRLAGYMLTGETSEQCYHILLGGGKNGKTVFTETLFAILGDYAAAVPWTTFDYATAEQRNFGLSMLPGKRLVLASEIPEGRKLNESIVKGLVGGDTMQVERKHKDAFMMKAQFKLIMATNHLPKIVGTDEGIWRRTKKIDFDVTIPAEKRDPEFMEKLLTREGEGILAWCVEGCREWRRIGLRHPDKVEAATAEYREDMDILGQWIAESCVERAGIESRVDALYGSYKDWCKQNGFENPMAKTTLGHKLKERRYKSRHGKTGTFWQGIGVRVEGYEEPEPDQTPLGGADGF